MWTPRSLSTRWSMNSFAWQVEQVLRRAQVALLSGWVRIIGGAGDRALISHSSPLRGVLEQSSARRPVSFFVHLCHLPNSGPAEFDAAVAGGGDGAVHEFAKPALFQDGEGGGRRAVG